MSDGGGASVQLENGYTRIAQPLMEALVRAPLTGGQCRVALHVIRETYGWSRNEAAISYGAFEVATGLARSAMRKALGTLTAAGVVLVISEPQGRVPGVYRIQKDPSEWGDLNPDATATVPLERHSEEGGRVPLERHSTQCLQRGTVPLERHHTVPLERHHTVPLERHHRTSQTPEPQQVPPSERKGKKGKKSTTGGDDLFDRAWRAYPRRRGSNPRPTAAKAWSARIAAGVDPADLLAGVERYARFCAAEGKVDTVYVMQAARFFGPGLEWTNDWDSDDAGSPGGGPDPSDPLHPNNLEYID